jgi:hypothetical protein
MPMWIDYLWRWYTCKQGKIFQSQWNVVNWNRISRWCLIKKTVLQNRSVT